MPVKKVVYGKSYDPHRKGEFVISDRLRQRRGLRGRQDEEGSEDEVKTRREKLKALGKDLVLLVLVLGVAVYDRITGKEGYGG